MNVDLINSLSYGQLIAPISSATNNAASVGLDTQQYIGQMSVIVNAGIRTAGDAGSQFVVLLQASATNAASNATNCVGTFGSIVFSGTTNNTASQGILTFDKRAEFRYLFLRTVITGGNSPAAPVSASFVGMLQQQPN